MTVEQASAAAFTVCTEVGDTAVKLADELYRVQKGTVSPLDHARAAHAARVTLVRVLLQALDAAAACGRVEALAEVSQ